MQKYFPKNKNKKNFKIKQSSKIHGFFDIEKINNIYGTMTIDELAYRPLISSNFQEIYEKFENDELIQGQYNLENENIEGLVRHIKKKNGKFTIYEGFVKNGEPSGYGRLI